ncbi:MAG: nitroreductase family protein [Acidimicrobiia bacterium]
MDLIDALRTTGSVRDFTDEPVPDEVIHRLLDTARFAPNGGNRQAWKVVVLRDPQVRARMRDAYLIHWYEYLALRVAGLTPFAPVHDPAAEAAALEREPELRAAAEAGAVGFAERIDQAPVLLAVLADLQHVAAMDRGFSRYTMVGGASIYPFVWSILLAAHEEGLAGVMTTAAIREEGAAEAILGAPPEYAMAALIALGHPEGRRPTRLRRNPVEEFTTVDSCTGPAFRID